MNEDTKVLFKFGYDITLCVSLKCAVQLMEVLTTENLLRQISKYKDNKNWEILEPYGTDQISITYIAPADYLIRLAAGEKEE